MFQDIEGIGGGYWPMGCAGGIGIGGTGGLQKQNKISEFHRQTNVARLTADSDATVEELSFE